MKKILSALLVVSLFAATPVFAMNMDHMGSKKDMNCTKCDVLLKSCAQQADSIQQEIKRLHAAIKSARTTATAKDVAKLEKLKAKLADAEETLKSLQEQGGY